MIFKRNLKYAYRQMPVCPGDYNLLAYCWKQNIYVDHVLPMGLRSTALICQRLTNAVSFIYSKRGWYTVNYLDYLGGGGKADKAFEELAVVIDESGLHESVEKKCPLNIGMVFLGIMFETENVTLSVTEERMLEVQQLLSIWQQNVSAMHKEVQKLICKLNYIAKCVRPGRIFISGMLEFLRSFSRVGAQPLSLDCRKDVEWWARFLPVHNDVSMMALEEWSEPDEILASDACLVGGGGWSVLPMYFSGIHSRTKLTHECLRNVDSYCVCPTLV